MNDKFTIRDFFAYFLSGCAFTIALFIVDYQKIITALSVQKENLKDFYSIIFLKVPFFEDIGIKTLEYLDSLFQVDNIQRSMFYKSLPQVIDKLPMVEIEI